MRPVIVSTSGAPVGAALIALTLAACGGKTPPPATAPAGPPPAPTLEQVQSATVSGVFDQAVTFRGGRYEGEPFAPDAAARPTAIIWDSTFHTADLDGVAGNEAVAMLSSNSGGSGEFVWVAVFGTRDGKVANLGTAPVGDRTRLQAMWVERGKVVMDVIEAGPADAACCPTQVARKAYGFEGGTFKQLSSEVRGVLALSMLAANEWTLVEMDGKSLPAGIEPPLVHFENGTVRGFAGCNRFNATVTESKPGEIDVGPATATKKACPPAEMEIEQTFLAELDAVNRYWYLAGQLALGYQDGDRAGVLLFRK
jgi:heat shock protein HslJ